MENRKQFIAILAVTFIVLVLITYGALSFYCVSFNISEWSKETRGTMSIMILFELFISAGVAVTNYNNN